MKVHLEKIQVHELHSRPYDGLKLEGLADGVTAVYAPNAAGKSVLARAASLALQPDKLKKTDRITGCVRVGGTSYDVDLRGRPDAVAWPQCSREDLYRLSVAEVMAKLAPEDQQKIREALAGGINLAKLAVPAPGQKPKKKIEDAWEALDKRQSVARQLADAEARLPALEQQQTQAEQAGADAALLHHWLEAAGLTSAAKQLETDIRALADQNPGVEKQSHDAATLVENTSSAYRNLRKAHDVEQENLKRFGSHRAPQPLQATDARLLQECETTYDQYAGGLARRKQEHAEAVRAAATARRNVQRLHDQPAPVPLGVADQQALEAAVADVKQADTEARDCGLKCHEAEAALLQAYDNFRKAGGDPERVPTTPVSADDLQEAVDFDAQIAAQYTEVSRAAQACTEAQRALEEQARQLPNLQVPSRDALDQLLREPQIANLMDTYRAAVQRQNALNEVARQLEQKAATEEGAAAGLDEAATALRDWLRSAATPASPVRPGVLIAVTAVAVLIAITVGATGAWLWATVLALGGMLALVILATRNHNGAAAAMPVQQQAADRVPPPWRPPAWTADSVATALVTVIQKTEAVNVWRQKRDESQLLASAVDVDGPRQQLEARIALLREQAGVSVASPTDYSLATLVHGLLALADAELALAHARKTKRAADERLAQLREGLSALVHDTIGAPAGIVTGAAAKVWADRLDALRQADATCRTKKQSAKDKDGASQAARERLRAFFGRFDWPCMDDAALARAQFLEWFGATETARLADEQVRETEEQLNELSASLKDAEDAMREIFRRYGFADDSRNNPRAATTAFREWFAATARLTEAEKALAEAQKQVETALAANGLPGEPGQQVLSLEARRSECLRRAANVVPRLNELRRQREDALREAQRLQGQTDWDGLFRRLGLAEENPTRVAIAAAEAELEALAAKRDEVKNQITLTANGILHAEQANDLRSAQVTMNRAVDDMDAWWRRRQDQCAWEAVVGMIGEAVRAEATPAIVRRANEYLSVLTGDRYGNVTADEVNVQVTDNVEGRRKTVEQLSTGTRVHLALALRLAVIEASETSGYAFPLLLDEVMATSDPDASTAIAQAVKRIAETRQVLLFTNQPDDLNVLRSVCSGPLVVKTLRGAALPTTQKPEAAPALPAQSIPAGQIPLAAAVSQWPPALVAEVLEGLDPACQTVWEALQNQTDQGRRDRNQAVLAAAEAVRERVAKAHRTLEPASLDSVDWVTEAFRERVAELLQRVAGEPRAFLDGFRDLPRMREDKIAACENWLEENGYLVAKPAREELRQLASARLPAAMPDRDETIERICRLFTG